MTQDDTAIDFESLTDEEIMDLAKQGFYRHTFFEMWETALNGHIETTLAPLTLDIASSILGAYGWLTHADLEGYREGRVELFEEARDTLLDILGDNKEKIYKESQGDWERHQELYVQLIAAWNLLVVEWGKQWEEIANSGEGPDPVAHAYIGDVSGILMSPQYGFIEGLKSLHDFDFTEANREMLNELMGVKTDD